MFGLGMWGAWALECPAGVGYALYWMSGGGGRGYRRPHTLEALRGSALASEKGPTGDCLEREVNL